jgi:hypothetical protein
MTLNMSASTGGGAPKIKKNASRKNKKSWRKNVDMSAVEEYLEEKRFDERIGKIIFSFMSRESYRRKHFVIRLSVSLVLLRLSAVCFRKAVLLSVLCIRIRTYVLDISDADLSNNKQK